MKRLKLFLSNFFVYGIGGVIGKVIPLIMLPIVTRLMPDTAFFGLNDISVTVVSFATYLGVMGMYDAMFRLFFDKEDETFKKSICSSALIFTTIVSFIIFLIFLIGRNWLAELIFSSDKYVDLLMVSAFSALIGTTNSIVSAPTRFLNQRKVFLATNTISPLVSYSIAIPLLLKGYYVLALPLAALVSVTMLEVIFFILNKKWFSLKAYDSKLVKQMLVIAIPLLPNFLIYWIFNSADRLMIAKILGNSQTGIYAIGSKLGNVSQLIYTAFAGGWQYFAFSLMKEDDQVQMNSDILEYLLAVSTAASIAMMTLGRPIFTLFFEGDYMKGSEVAPYLFAAPLLLMLYQVGCNQFLIVKKTWPNFVILSIGAVVNLVLNLCLIPMMGIEGAAIATLTGYLISVLICMFVLKKLKLLVISVRMAGLFGFFVVSFIIWRLFLSEHLSASLIYCIIACIGILFLYRKELLLIWRGLKKKC